MTTQITGEIRPNSAHLARAQTLAHQLFPTVTHDDAAVCLPWFRLVNVLTDAMTEALPPAGARYPSCIRWHAAGLVSRAIPPTQDPTQRIALPLAQLIDLLARAMAETLAPTPPAFAQAGALEHGIRQILAVLHDLRALAQAIDVPATGADTEKLPDDLALAEDALKMAARRAGALSDALLSIDIDSAGNP